MSQVGIWISKYFSWDTWNRIHKVKISSVNICYSNCTSDSKLPYLYIQLFTKFPINNTSYVVFGNLFSNLISPVSCLVGDVVSSIVGCTSVVLDQTSLTCITGIASGRVPKVISK